MLSGIDWLAVGAAAAIGFTLPCVVELFLRIARIRNWRYHAVHITCLMLVAPIAIIYARDLADIVRLYWP